MEKRVWADGFYRVAEVWCGCCGSGEILGFRDTGWKPVPRGGLLRGGLRLGMLGLGAVLK